VVTSQGKGWLVVKVMGVVTSQINGCGY